MSKNNNIAYQVDTVGADALAVFFERYASAYRQIEQALLMLDLDPADEVQISELLLALKSIQKALTAIDFGELAKLSEVLIELLEAIQDRQLPFQKEFSDIVLLSVDAINTILQKIIEGEERCVMLARLPKAINAINGIIEGDSMHRDELIRDVELLLDPATEILEPSQSASQDSLRNLFDNSAPDEEELAAYGVEENEDFIFFKGMVEPLESRAKYWKGRSQRMLRLALQMNDHAGRPVDPNQLTAAVYMHDAGMALLPLDVINKESTLSDDDVNMVRDHPIIGYELLRYMKQWREASAIVLQHHERADGTGYPNGLKENEICEGAKILAIVDAIDARTHERVFASIQQRPLLRAAMEIGKGADSHFSAYWVNIFKDVFQKMRKQEQTLETN